MAKKANEFGRIEGEPKVSKFKQNNWDELVEYAEDRIEEIEEIEEIEKGEK